MDGAGIRDGALLIVDRALEATDGSIVIAVVDGDRTVKRLRKKKDRSYLEAANPKYPPIEVTTEDIVWGVVAHAVNTYHRRTSMFGLVDRNNFYASCEHVFKPRLERRADRRTKQQRRLHSRTVERSEGPWL